MDATKLEKMKSATEDALTKGFSAQVTTLSNDYLDFIAECSPAAVLELICKYERLRECHQSISAHTINCAIAQKKAGTWGRKGNQHE